MASSINASTSGGGGIITTADATGNLNIQSGGSTVVAVTSSGATVTGTLAATGAVSGTTGTFTSTLGVTGAITGSSTVAGSTGILYPLTSGTAVASTSGTSIDFTGIPSWVKRITVMFNGVSTNGTSNILVRLGNSGGVVATGYVSQAAILSASTRSTTGFIITQEMSPGGLLYGQFICNLQNSATNAWSGSAALDKDDNNNPWSAGALTTMASVCTTVRITTVGGTNTFDAGSVNILYE